MLRARDSAAPRLRLLSSPTAFALRAERLSLMIWTASLGAFAFIIGVISKSVSAAGISKSLERELEKFGSGSILTPRGYVGFTSIFFVLALSLFACAQVGAARHEESEQQLETQLATAGQPGALADRTARCSRSPAPSLLAVAVGFFGWLGTRRRASI